MTAATLYPCIADGCDALTEGLYCDACRAAGWGTSKRPSKDTARTHSPAEADVLEADVSAACDAYLELHGWTVYRIGISEAGRVYQTPGIPDRLVIHEATARWSWVEYKRPHGGQQSDAQREFERLCGVMGWPYLIVTSMADVERLDKVVLVA